MLITEWLSELVMHKVKIFSLQLEEPWEWEREVRQTLIISLKEQFSEGRAKGIPFRASVWSEVMD